jgi:hypothetical protein
LALGAATGRPSSEITAAMTGCALHRNATVGKPERTKSGTRSLAGSTMVNGPGQNAAANSCASDPAGPPTSDKVPIHDASATCTISGSKDGRSFAAKTLPAASALSASQANP